MNVRDWPMGQIMQLPDCCFGRRWLVSCSFENKTVGTFWDISESAFPENIVIWELSITAKHEVLTGNFVRIALGDHLPTAAAEVDRLEPLFRGHGLTGAEPRQIVLPYADQHQITSLKQNVATSGRRMVVEFLSFGPGSRFVIVGVVVSSIPTEVPDCLISGYLRDR